MNASEARSEPQASGGGGAGYAGAVPARRARGTAPTWLVCSLLALSVLAVYAQTLGFGFVSYDDTDYVVTNPKVRQGLTWEGLRWAFTSFDFANWFPLTWLSLMLDAEIAGASPRMFHLTNLLLHTASTLLLFRVLDRATGARWKSAWVAALFAVHPLHVESVAWIAERKDVLSTLFGFLAMLAWLRWVERPGAVRQAVVMVCFALGLLCKQMLVTLPGVLLLFDFWPLARHRRVALLSLLREKIPLFLLAATASVLAVIAQRAGGAIGSLGTYPLGARLANAVVSYATYLLQTFWPAGLAVFYPHPGSELPIGATLEALALLSAITAVVVILRRSRPYLAVGWLWYLGTLLPVIGIVQVGLQARADRYTYLPLVGIFIMLGWGVPDLLGQRRKLLAGIAVASVLAAAWLAALQTAYWRESIPLFERAIEVTGENSLAQHNLASAYYQRNQPGDLERALSQVGRLAEAEQRCSQALRRSSEPACAHYNLGRLRLQQSRILEAEEHLATAVRIPPHDTDARVSLGVVLATQGRLEEARAQYVEALRLDPSNQIARSNLDRIRAESRSPP